jgi:hypothetical protein
MSVFGGILRIGLESILDKSDRLVSNENKENSAEIVEIQDD